MDDTDFLANFPGLNFPFLGNETAATEQESSIKIPPKHNFLEITLEDNSWVSVWDGDQAVVSDRSSTPVLGFRLPPGSYTVRTDGTVQTLTSRAIDTPPSLLEQVLHSSPSQLRLSSDAPDHHIVDGVGEIPADGQSFCTITVEKVGLDGSPKTAETDNDPLFLRTTGGTLMDATGERSLRALQLTQGTATFRLVSEPQPKVVTVSVLCQNAILANADLQIEFVGHLDEPA
jgi:hypothetical protein